MLGVTKSGIHTLMNAIPKRQSTWGAAEVFYQRTLTEELTHITPAVLIARIPMITIVLWACGTSVFPITKSNGSSLTFDGFHHNLDRIFFQRVYDRYAELNLFGSIRSFSGNCNYSSLNKLSENICFQLRSVDELSLFISLWKFELLRHLTIPNFD